MDKVTELFGSNVFNDSVMIERLPKDTYKILKSAIKEGKGIDSSIADTVASAMKDWASTILSGFSRLPALPPKSTTAL